MSCIWKVRNPYSKWGRHPSLLFLAAHYSTGIQQLGQHQRTFSARSRKETKTNKQIHPAQLFLWGDLVGMRGMFQYDSFKKRQEGKTLSNENKSHPKIKKFTIQRTHWDLSTQSKIFPANLLTCLDIYMIHINTVGTLEFPEIGPDPILRIQQVMALGIWV